METCSICLCELDLETEGGSSGSIGMVPVTFCPNCTAGVFDFCGPSDDELADELETALAMVRSLELQLALVRTKEQRHLALVQSGFL